MSHWYRVFRPVAARTLLFYPRRTVFLDYGLPAELMRYLPKDARALKDACLVEALSRLDVVKLCQRERGILLTSDWEYAPLLSTNIKVPCGVVLLPDDERKQHDALYQLSCGKLVLKLEFKRKHFIAHARNSTLLLDHRREHRTMSVYFNCF
jgi:hypothetical protein